jgi:intraflagellar transport protein 56
MCYYKLERYDVSNEILSTYLVKYPNSCCALNLKASNDYQVSGAKAAEKEFKKLSQISSPFFSYMKELRQHNEIVFRDGADAELQVFQNLVDDIPEARINLAIYHLKNSNYDDACRLFTELQPETSLEYTLKGFCHAGRWQVSGDQDDLHAAQECFKSVGSDEVDRDTILGRQSMVSLFFLEVRYEDCLTYLNSIKVTNSNHQH